MIFVLIGGVVLFGKSFKRTELLAGALMVSGLVLLALDASSTGLNFSLGGSVFICTCLLQKKDTRFTCEFSGVRSCVYLGMCVCVCVCLYLYVCVSAIPLPLFLLRIPDAAGGLGVRFLVLEFARENPAQL